MKKTIFLFQIIIIIFGITTANAEPNIGDEVTITVNQLRLRESPNQDSKIITLLQKGQFAYIIEISKYSEKIKDIESKWFKIRTNGKDGWAFGGFLETTNRTQVKETDKYMFWFDRSEEDAGNKHLFIKMKDSNDIRKIKIDSDTCDYKISQNNKYLAIDIGTDVIGVVEIYEIESQKLIYNAEYSPRNLAWDNNSLEIHRVISTHYCYLLWELDIFNNGKIKKNTGTGKGEYHCE